MTNRQPLSPAGYLINNDPLNTNPFFTFDSGEIDPSTLERIQILEDTVDDIVVDYVNTSEFTQFQTETTNSINSLTDLIGQANALLETI